MTSHPTTMEYRHSQVVDPSLYDNDGLFEGIALRVHHNTELEDRGCIRARRDWQRLHDSVPSTYTGVMGPEYSFVSTWLPETLPDRFELMAYMHEMAFLFDDMIDDAEDPTTFAMAYMADFFQVHRLVMGGGDLDKMKSISNTPITTIFADVTKAMVAVDAERTRTVFHWVEKWGLAFINRPTPKDFRDFDHYLEYRFTNFASEIAFGVWIFAMGLSIPLEQQQICLDLSRPLWLQLSLTNDCHSWEREHKAVADNKQSSVTNGIWVLIEKHSMTLEEAQSACREKARGYAADYLEVLEAVKTRDDLCQDAPFLLDALQYAISGNAVWSLQCPRYHPERELNQAQLEMAKKLGAEDTIGQHHEGSQLLKDSIESNDSIDSESNGQAGKAMDHHDMAILRDSPVLGTKALEAPSRYLDSQPSKGIRDQVIDALNAWFQLPPGEVTVVKKIVNLLHGASLMLDDIEDGSQLRRGKPAAHLVFGDGITVNAAGYRFLDALIKVRQLKNERCTDIFCDELRDLYIGQSHDLTWTRNMECPAEEEYLAMVDNKTAGLFRMLARMLDAMSDSPIKPDLALLTRFMTLLGRLFQIRDDYINLTSADYAKQKGFCEDLDEGKYSLPLIHALRGTKSLGVLGEGNYNAVLAQSLLSRRHAGGPLSLDQKKLLLQLIKDCGGLDYTRKALNALHDELKKLVAQMGMHGGERFDGSV